MAVPPYLLKNASKAPSLSSAERSSLEKTYQHALQLDRQRLQNGQRPSLPTCVVERLVNDLNVECADEVREEARRMLEMESRWPRGSGSNTGNEGGNNGRMKVTEEVLRAVDENPWLWAIVPEGERGTDKPDEVGDRGQEERGKGRDGAGERKG